MSIIRNYIGSRVRVFYCNAAPGESPLIGTLIEIPSESNGGCYIVEPNESKHLKVAIKYFELLELDKPEK